MRAHARVGRFRNDEGQEMTEFVTKEQKSNLHRRLCQAGLSTSQIEEERSAIVRRLRSAGISDRSERLTQMWRELAATHLNCDLDGKPLSGQVGQIEDDREVAEDRITPAQRSISQPDWPFRISRGEAALELADGEGRTSSYADRVEWVSQNLDMPSATPLAAPCNAAWSMLVWGTVNRKEFFAQQRQLMSKRELEHTEEAELDADLKKFDDLISRFGCYRKLDAMIQSGELDLSGPSPVLRTL
jgi:hypothetical protein